MLIEGYRLKGYDATYEPALFDVRQSKNGVLIVEDINSGTEFILPDMNMQKGKEQKKHYEQRIKKDGKTEKVRHAKDNDRDAFKQGPSERDGSYTDAVSHAGRI